MERLNSAKHFNEIVSENDLVFIDVYASWCGPCKQIAPAIEKLANEKRRIRFVKLDCEEFTEVSDGLKISSLPTFLLIKDKKIIKRVVGADLSEVKEMLASY